MAGSGVIWTDVCTNCRETKRQGVPFDLMFAIFEDGNSDQHHACSACAKLIKAHNAQIEAMFDKKGAANVPNQRPPKGAANVPNQRPPKGGAKSIVPDKIVTMEDGFKYVDDAPLPPVPSTTDMLLMKLLEQQGKLLEALAPTAPPTPAAPKKKITSGRAKRK